MECYIEYLDCKNNFVLTTKSFKDYSEALEWTKNNIEGYNLDMIKYY